MQRSLVFVLILSLHWATQRTLMDFRQWVVERSGLLLLSTHFRCMTKTENKHHMSVHGCASSEYFLNVSCIWTLHLTEHDTFYETLNWGHKNTAHAVQNGRLRLQYFRITAKLRRRSTASSEISSRRKVTEINRARQCKAQQEWNVLHGYHRCAI